MFGKMVRRHAPGLAIFAAMFAMMVIGVAVIRRSSSTARRCCAPPESTSRPATAQSGGNMSDKEVRFGIANTALWAMVTTNASNGSVNGGHDALTAGGGAVPIANMFTGEVIFGGVGSGLYGMIFYVVITVFVAGLMVGRTPEYLGKKIEAREVKLAAVGALFVPTMVLVLTAISVVTDVGLASVFNPGAHGFSEALYAYTRRPTTTAARSPATARPNFSAALGTVALYLGRFVPLIAALALGGVARRQEDRARLGGHVPHRRRDVLRPARCRHRPHRRADDLPGAHARPDRGGALVIARSSSVPSSPSSCCTAVFGFAYPALMTGFAQLASRTRRTAA